MKSSCGTKKKYAAGGAVMRGASAMRPGMTPKRNAKMPAYKKGGMVKKAK